MPKIHSSNYQAVVQIGFLQNNVEFWSGTGFWLFDLFEEKHTELESVIIVEPQNTEHQLQPVEKIRRRPSLYLVTAKQIVENVLQHEIRSLIVRFQSRATQMTLQVSVPLFDTEQKPFYFFDDVVGSECAVIPVNLYAAVPSNFSFLITKNALSMEQIDESGIGEGDEVFTIGYLSRIGNFAQNFPVVRAGTVACMQKSYVQTENHFLIDVSVGRSENGSPVLIVPAIGSDRWRLIGIVSSPDDNLDVDASYNSRNIRATSSLSRICTVDSITRTIAIARAANRISKPQLMPVTAKLSGN